MKIKAISLLQPCASLIALNAKKIEPLSWATRYKGPIAIYAMRPFTPQEKTYFELPLFREILTTHGYKNASELPVGQIIAIAQLTNIIPVEELLANRGGYGLTEQEEKLGDYSPGGFGWLFSRVVKLATPIEAVGMQGLWGVEIPDLCSECQGAGAITSVDNRVVSHCIFCAGSGQNMGA